MPALLDQWSERQSKIRVKTDIEVLAVGVAASQGSPGVGFGSVALLGCGLLERLQTGRPGCYVHHDYTIHTYREAHEPDLVEESERWSSSKSGSLSSTISGMKRPFEVSYACERLSEQVYRQARRGRMVLTLGGDHSIAIGTISGAARACRERYNRAPAVIWVDARPDISTTDGNSSRSIRDMPLTFLSGIVKTSLGEPFGWMEEINGDKEPTIDLSKLVYIGLRDLEPADISLLKRHRVKAFSMADVQSLGIERVMEETLDHVGLDTPIHLSFDLAAMDPLIAPATDRPVPNGLDLDQARHLCHEIRSTGKMISMDLVEVNPMQGVREGEIGEGTVSTVQAAIAVAESAFGADV